MKPSTKKELKAWLIISALQLAWIVPCGYAYTHQEPKEPQAVESNEDIIRWKQEDTETHEEDTETHEEHTETHVEPLEIETVAEAEKIRFYNVPLSEEMQLHIFEECEKHNIAPSIIIAMIERESDFDAKTVGDNGNSFGLMQIQPKWHKDTMDRLGCNDLLDPFENVTVGIAIVADLIETNPDLYWVLMAYNGGPSYASERMKTANYSDYALEVVEHASELEKAVSYGY